MSFGASPCTFNILGGQQLPKTTQQKVLGFWISDNLSLSYHHQKASKAAFCVLKMLHRSFPIMGKEDFPFLFGTYIRPILEYGSQIAHTGLIRDRDCLKCVQRLGTKLVKGISDLSYYDRLYRTQPLPFGVSSHSRRPNASVSPFSNRGRVRLLQIPGSKAPQGARNKKTNPVLTAEPAYAITSSHNG